MKRRNLLVLLVAGVLFLSFLRPFAWAGDKQRHRWEGVAIGVGATLLGTALYRCCTDHQRCAVVTAPYHAPRYRYPRHPGHWEVRKQWVPPAYRRIWKPGHYSRHGRWCPGHWVRVRVRPGHWTETRVWVACR